jgi:hypothetical protein
MVLQSAALRLPARQWVARKQDGVKKGGDGGLPNKSREVRRLRALSAPGRGRDGSFREPGAEPRGTQAVKRIAMAGGDLV